MHNVTKTIQIGQLNSLQGPNHFTCLTCIMAAIVKSGRHLGFPNDYITLRNEASCLNTSKGTHSLFNSVVGPHIKYYMKNGDHPKHVLSLLFLFFVFCCCFFGGGGDLKWLYNSKA